MSLASSNRLPMAAITCLYGAFFISGASSFIYQTVWVRMLTRFLGSTTAATALVLAVFLAGLALGALAGGLFADRLRKPLSVYRAIEIMIAALGLFSSIIAVDIWGNWFIANAIRGTMTADELLWGRMSCAAASVWPPSFLMGMALPVLVSFCSRHSNFQQGLGRLYAMNTLGAVLGVLAAGYVLIGTFGETGAVLVAGFGNIGAAMLVMIPRRYQDLLPSPMLQTKGVKKRPKPLPAPLYAPLQRRLALIGLMVSGASALAFEVLWMRLLMLPLATSIYSFSLVLAVMLLGIGSGSWLSTKTAFTLRRPLAVFGLGALAVSALAAAGMWQYAGAAQASQGFLEPQGYGWVAIWLVLPAALAFGWQFPVAARCCLVYPDVPGSEAGRVYTLNMLGAIGGSLAAAFLILPQIGVTSGLEFLCLINAAVGAVLLGVAPPEERKGLLWLGPVCILVLLMSLLSAGQPYQDVIAIRVNALLGEKAEVLALYEDVAGTTAVAGIREDNRIRQLVIDGEAAATLSSDTQLLANLPIAMAPFPRTMLVLRFGTGTTLRAGAMHPNVEKVTAVDGIPNVFDAFGHFHADAQAIRTNPKVNLVADDPRNYLLLHKERNDIITISPALPLWSAGSVNLYTKEFLELCKARLTSNGLVALRLPPAPASELHMLMKTFATVFPGASLWRGPESGFYCIGGKRPLDRLQEDMPLIGHKVAGAPGVADWGADVANPETIQGLLLLGPAAFAAFVEPFDVVTDNSPRTEFPLWRGALDQYARDLDMNLLDLELQKRNIHAPWGAPQQPQDDQHLP